MLWSTDTFKGSQPRRCTVADAINLFDLSLEGCVFSLQQMWSPDWFLHISGASSQRRSLTVLGFFDSRRQMREKPTRARKHHERIWLFFFFFFSERFWASTDASWDFVAAAWTCSPVNGSSPHPPPHPPLAQLHAAARFRPLMWLARCLLCLMRLTQIFQKQTHFLLRLSVQILNQVKGEPLSSPHHYLMVQMCTKELQQHDCNHFISELIRNNLLCFEQYLWYCEQQLVLNSICAFSWCCCSSIGVNHLIIIDVRIKRALLLYVSIAIPCVGYPWGVFGF